MGDTEPAAGLVNVRQAIEILKHLGKSRAPLHVRALAEHISTSKSTVQRILAALDSTQMVRFDQETDSYRLGPGIVALHADYTAGQDSLQQVRDVMDGLRQRTGETVMLSIRYGLERLVILRVESLHSLRYVRPVGENYPMHTGATSKALLSALPDAELDEVLARLDYVPRVPNAITEVERLRKEIEATKRKGYAISREESVLGVAGLAAPVQVAGLGPSALGIYGPLQRFTDADVEHHVGALMAAVSDINNKIH